MTPASSKTQIIWLEDRIDGLEKRLKEVERLNKPPTKLLAIPEVLRQAGWMPNPLLFDHGGEHGQCVSLYDYNYLRAKAVELTKFQLERAAANEQNRPLTDAEIIETCATWVVDDIGSDEVIKIVRRTERAHGIWKKE